jgi:hypothetical protein
MLPTIRITERRRPTLADLQASLAQRSHRGALRIRMSLQRTFIALLKGEKFISRLIFQECEAG